MPDQQFERIVSGNPKLQPLIVYDTIDYLKKTFCHMEMYPSSVMIAILLPLSEMMISRLDCNFHRACH